MACSIMSRLSSGIEKSSGGAFLTNSARAAAIFLASFDCLAVHAAVMAALRSDPA
jgi:hypothetical protein